MSIILKEGDKAPIFSALDQNGQIISLEKNTGKVIVLYFYPKDSTPGCTIEAKGFRDLFPEFVNNNTVIFGVSKDSEISHKKFSSSCSLPFPLLVDEEAEISKKYGALGEKSLFGKHYIGIKRMTFLIDEAGMISKIWDKINVKNHPSDVLKAIKSR